MKTFVFDVRANVRAVVVCIFLLGAVATFLSAQSESSNEWTETVGGHYIVHPDQTYGFQSNIALKLDVWQPNGNERPLPTVIYIHGGGWLYGDRTGALPQLLPYFARGWNVVNVEYRMSGQSFAPAAVDDSVCALRWVYRNAKQFHFDLDRIIVTGHSAGGHLALMVGMFDPLSGFDKGCPADPAWGDVAAIAKQVSPLTYVRPGLPAIITIHGDHDDVVPYSQSVRLHEALTKVGVKNELVTIYGGKHGWFSDKETLAAYDKLWKFLDANVAGLNLDSAAKSK
jgi:acetyl esterase/lipase